MSSDRTQRVLNDEPPHPRARDGSAAVARRARHRRPPPTAPGTSSSTASTSSRHPTATAARASCSGCGCRRTSIYLYFVLGGVLVLLGLSIWEALAITVIGNLWWAAVGWLAVSGPASGTPSVAIMRAMFGVRGNRVFGGGLGVAIGLFYEIINIAVATLAANALLGILGVPLPAGAEWIVLVVVAALSFVLSVYGHATILKLAPVFSAALAVAFVVLAVFVLGAADFSYDAGAHAGRRPLGDAAARLRDRRLGPALVGHRRRLRPLPAAATPRSARSPGGPRSAASSPPCSSARLGVVAGHRDRHDRPAAHHRRDRARMVHADLPRDRRARQHHEQRARRVLHRPLRAGARLPGAPAPPRS